MTKAHKTPGALVEIHHKMYEPPYAPWYDMYKNEVFEVQDPNKYSGHMMIKNVNSGELTCIHDDEVKTISKIRFNKIIKR